MTWCFLDWRIEGKWSTVGLCSGIVAGLVAITPASGFVPPWAAVVFGVVGGTAANYGTKVKNLLVIDDALDIFAVHAIAGFSGNILTAFFAANYIAHLDGTTVIPGGWLNQHWMQLGYQLIDSFSGGLYSFCGTWLICMVLNCLPGLQLRLEEGSEVAGVDDSEIGEFAYDYVELTRELLGEGNEAQKRNNQAANPGDAGSCGAQDGNEKVSIGGQRTIRQSHSSLADGYSRRENSPYGGNHGSQMNGIFYSEDYNFPIENHSTVPRNTTGDESDMV